MSKVTGLIRAKCLFPPHGDALFTPGAFDPSDIPDEGEAYTVIVGYMSRCQCILRDYAGRGALFLTDVYPEGRVPRSGMSDADSTDVEIQYNNHLSTLLSNIEGKKGVTYTKDDLFSGRNNAGTTTQNRKAEIVSLYRVVTNDHERNF